MSVEACKTCGAAFDPAFVPKNPYPLCPNCKHPLTEDGLATVPFDHPDALATAKTRLSPTAVASERAAKAAVLSGQPTAVDPTKNQT